MARPNTPFDRLADLIECGRMMPDITRILGITEQSVVRALDRHGRRDLVSRITPRAEYDRAS